jgi:hypothetical protein
VAALRETIIAFFEAAMVEDQLVLPYAKQGLLGDERARALRGLRHYRPDYEGARPARRDRAPAKNPRHFVSSISPIDWLQRESLHHACEPDGYLLDTPWPKVEQGRHRLRSYAGIWVTG